MDGYLIMGFLAVISKPLLTLASCLFLLFAEFKFGLG